MIKIENLVKEFGDLEVLKGISKEISEGEVISIIGPSGSGKSTFLRCINRLEEPTSGKLFVNGKNIMDPQIDINKIREEVGMVFQHFNLFPHKSVLENVILGPIKLKKISRMEAEVFGVQLLEKVGLADKKDAYPNKLSGGQKQRVAIARALANDPDFILADEPTGNLDSKNELMVFEELKKLCYLGKGVLVVSHNDAVIDFADKIYTMKDGVLGEK